jgi:glucosamine-phosphate N-acetyltransferase
MKEKYFENLTYFSKGKQINIRLLEKNDYNKEYLLLLEQLTIVNKDIILDNAFENFVEKLGKNHYILVMECDDIIIGSGTVLIEQKLIHGMSQVGHIEDIIIHKEYRGFGLGKKIIYELEQISKNNNCYKTVLYCDPDNVEFYTKIDYENKGCYLSKYF